MIRGTTPTHIFKLPLETRELKEVRISYAQDNRIIVEKAACDCILEGDTITVTLKQEDTLKFSSRDVVMVQVKVLTTSGNVLASNAIKIRAGEILNEEVLV